MGLLRTFGNTRRSRQRQAVWGVVRWIVLAVLIVGGAAISYGVGVAQSRIEVVRLETDLANMHELNRMMSERVAKAEQQAEAAITRFAQLQQVYRSEVPTGEVRRLLELVEERLKAGISADRLAFLLREARVERNCEKGVETQRVLVHTPINTTPVNSVAFANNRVTITSEGLAARAPNGGPETWFDPAKPVVLRFLKIDGDVTTTEGMLPLSHALVLGNEEYFFSARPTDKQPGYIDITMQRCAYP